MVLKLKKAKVQDMDMALELFRKTSLSLKARNLSQWSYWSNPPMEKIQWVRDGFQRGEFFFVCDESDDFLGMFRLLPVDELYWDEKGREPNVRYVHSLVIATGHSGKGIGALILKKIIENLRNEGIESLRLDCDSSNSRLCQYYEDQGFKKVGTKVTPYSVNNLYEMDLNP
jgi:RimJ/RimL family protein N-acetyltransferase